jgi:hypothetical protein
VASQKKCQDCGKRGNWPKKILFDTCPECTSLRLKHDVIRKEAYDRCASHLDGKAQCQPNSPSQCASCKGYFAGETHAFWVSLR